MIAAKQLMNIILNSVYSAVFKFTGSITNSIIISVKEQKRVMIMNNTILTDEEKEIFKKLVRPEIVVNISRYYLLNSERIVIRYKDKSFMDIPAIQVGLHHCEGMEKNRKYTLKELGL